MTDKKKLIFIMLEWSLETGRVIRYRYEGDEGESRLFVPDTTPDETNAGIVADVFQGDCTFEKGQLVVAGEALKQPPFVPLMPKDFEGSEWVVRYGFCDFNDGSPYTPLPPHAAKMLDAAHRRIVELMVDATRLIDELEKSQERVAELEAEVAEERRSYEHAIELMCAANQKLAASYERGAREFAEWMDGEDGIPADDPFSERPLARFLSSRGTAIAESNGEEG